MRIGINFEGVIATLQSDKQSVLLVEYALFYVKQIVKEGHEIVIISDQNVCPAHIVEKWLLANNLALQILDVTNIEEEIDAGAVLEMCICGDLEQLVLFIGKVKHLLFFSGLSSVDRNKPKGIYCMSSWWEVYNYIRYEI